MRRMTEVCQSDKCSGCSACMAVCHAGAISMRPDGEGFLHPVVDRAVCVGCGKCRAVCPQQNKPGIKVPLKVFAVKARNENVRLVSSSGGVFTLLAEDVLSVGGVVFGATFCGEEWQVCHVCVESAADLGKLRGSKYTQSRMDDMFKSVKSFLADRRQVVFCGTPCQIAGLKRYLSHVGSVDLSLLLSIEVICHGVSSPLAWRKYLEQRIADAGESRICGISFRKKNRGWKRFSVSIDFAGNVEYNVAFPEDAFMRGFLAELYNRRSCHDCICRRLHSDSDIVLGDFWGIERINGAFDDDKGVSAVLLMSAHGVSCFERIASKCDVWESSLEAVCAGNSALVRSPAPHVERNKFFARIGVSDFDQLVEKLLRPSLACRLRGFASRCLERLRIA